MKINSSVRLCFESKIKDSEGYPEWVLEDETDSEVASDSDSEFQNLFKMIQMNEYSTGSEESPASSSNGDTTPKVSGGEEEFVIGSDHSSQPASPGRKTAHFVDEIVQSEAKKIKVDLPGRQSGKLRIGITRPTLFMKSTSTTADIRKSLSQKRSSTSLSIGGAGGGNVAAMRILFLQNAFAENVLPLYRKKDRVYLSIRHGDFNRCHKSGAIKIADRVKRILNRNYIYLNDRDIAEDLELKFEKLIESKVIKKSKEMHDKWRLKEGRVSQSPVAEKIIKDVNKVSLANQLDFSMPHRDFETDITKYVKRLRELSDILNNQSNILEAKEDEIFTADITIEKDEIDKIHQEYVLIPTIEKYNKSRKKVSEREVSEPAEEYKDKEVDRDEEEYSDDNTTKPSSDKEKPPSLWKRFSDTMSKSWSLKSRGSQRT